MWPIWWTAPRAEACTSKKKPGTSACQPTEYSFSSSSSSKTCYRHTSTLIWSFCTLFMGSWKTAPWSSSRSWWMDSMWGSKKYTSRTVLLLWTHASSRFWTQHSDASHNWEFAHRKPMLPRTQEWWSTCNVPLPTGKRLKSTCKSSRTWAPPDKRITRGLFPSLKMRLRRSSFRHKDQWPDSDY